MTGIGVKEQITNLVTRAKGGNSQAYNELFALTSEEVFYYIYKQLNYNVYDTEDVLQETYFNVFKHLNSLENNTSFLPWVKKLQKIVV